jgi:hypothetical protein
MSITLDPNLFHNTHFLMLQQMFIVSEYLDEHKEVFHRDIMDAMNHGWQMNR